MDWSFEDLPEHVEVKHGDITIKGYPALVDKGTHVNLEVLNAKLAARKEMSAGLLRLIMLQLEEQRKYVAKNLLGFEKYSLYYATRGSREQLIEEIVSTIFRYTFIEGLSMIRNAETFRDRLMQKGRLMIIADEVSSILGQVLQDSNRIESELEKVANDHNLYACNDINQQLRRLIDPGFLKPLPYRWLRQYPRYLRAIRFRLDKLTSNIDRDRNVTKEVIDFSGKIADSYLEGSEMELYLSLIHI